MLFWVWLCVAAVQEARANYYCFGEATAHAQARGPRVRVCSIYNHVRTRLSTFLTEASKGTRCLCGSCCYRRHRLCPSRRKLEALRCGHVADVRHKQLSTGLGFSVMSERNTCLSSVLVLCSASLRVSEAGITIATTAWWTCCALGFKVPHSQDGPFYVLKDGRRMLAPLEQLVNNLRRTFMHEPVQQ